MMLRLLPILVLAACAQQGGYGPGGRVEIGADGWRRPTHYYPPPGPPEDPWGPYIREAAERYRMPERWVRSVKEECLSQLILFGENSLRRAPTQYIEHYHRERNHQGKANELLFPLPWGPARRRPQGAIRCRERLGGLLKYYERRAS